MSPCVFPHLPNILTLIQMFVRFVVLLVETWVWSTKNRGRACYEPYSSEHSTEILITPWLMTEEWRLFEFWLRKQCFFFHSIWEQNLPNRNFLLQIRFLEWAFQEVVGWANGSSVKLQSILYFQFMRLQTWDKLLIQKLNRIFYIKKYSVISAFRMKTFAIFYHSLNVTSSLLFSC